MWYVSHKGVLLIKKEKPQNKNAPSSLTLRLALKLSLLSLIFLGLISNFHCCFLRFKRIIKNYVFSCLRDKQFDGQAIKDPWEHLVRFYEIRSM